MPLTSYDRAMMYSVSSKIVEITALSTTWQSSLSKVRYSGSKWTKSPNIGDIFILKLVRLKMTSPCGRASNFKINQQKPRQWVTLAHKPTKLNSQPNLGNNFSIDLLYIGFQALLLVDNRKWFQSANENAWFPALCKSMLKIYLKDRVLNSLSFFFFSLIKKT